MSTFTNQLFIMCLVWRLRLCQCYDVFMRIGGSSNAKNNRLFKMATVQIYSGVYFRKIRQVWVNSTAKTRRIPRATTTPVPIFATAENISRNRAFGAGGFVNYALHDYLLKRRRRSINRRGVHLRSECCVSPGRPCPIDFPGRKSEGGGWETRSFRKWNDLGFKFPARKNGGGVPDGPLPNEVGRRHLWSSIFGNVCCWHL